MPSGSNGNRPSALEVLNMLGDEGPTLGSINPVEDFIGIGIANVVYNMASETGNGGFFASAGALVPGRPGIVVAGLFSSNSFASMYSIANSLVLGGGIYRSKCGFRLQSLSNSTDRWSLRVGGMGDISSQSPFDGSALPANGFFFRYTDNVNSGKWQIVCIQAGAETAVDTGITAATGTWYDFGFICSADGTSVSFYNGSTLIGTISTNVPTAGMAYMAISCVKTVGGNGLDAVHLDYYWAQQIFTTPR